MYGQTERELASAGSWRARRRIFGSMRSMFPNRVSFLAINNSSGECAYDGFGDGLSDGIDLRCVTTSGNSDTDVNVGCDIFS